MKLHLVSLGCARNLVDSEIMIGRLEKTGWEIVADPRAAEAIVVNTCSFIEPAADESIDTILQLAKYKKTGACRRLIVTGCLPERYRQDIVAALPEVDVFLGTGAYDQIVTAAAGAVRSGQCLLPDPDLLPLQRQDSPRTLSTGPMAYLKIAEGCSRHCSYCIIPRLRGTQKSRPLEDIAGEARALIRTGIRELVLVAQDTTFYGQDLQPPLELGRLLQTLVQIPARMSDETGPWLRVLYGHPESITDNFIKTVATYPQVCSYFDIPIQHAADRLLKRMGRRYRRDDLERLFDKIRSRVADAVLRTTIIVGFPGETDRDVEQLVQFVEKIRFDHLGVFVYSDAKDLPSHGLSAHVPAAVARARYDRLMALQQDIAAQNNRRYRGQTLNVLLEEALEDNLFAGRTAFQAPEVDGMIYVKPGPKMSPPPVGQFTKIRVTDTLEYDLMGETR